MAIASAKDRPDILVFPPLASVIAPATAVALGWLMPLRILPSAFASWSVIFGFLIIGLAGGLAITGVRAFKAAGTNVDPRTPTLTIVEAGPYRFTRNPMYLGMVILQVGLSFTFSLDWALIVAPILWAVLHYGVVLREEAYLIQKFGEPYTSYLRTTRRWI